MANYYGTTASNGGVIKKGKEKALEAYLEKWCWLGESDPTMEVQGSTLNIYGYDDFGVYPVGDDGEADWDAGDDTEGFLKGLVPFLKVQGKDKDKNLIVIQTVGNEKCCFPLGACEFAPLIMILRMVALA
jgi:hypothetical protein